MRFWAAGIGAVRTRSREEIAEQNVVPAGPRRCSRIHQHLLFLMSMLHAVVGLDATR